MNYHISFSPFLNKLNTSADSALVYPAWVITSGDFLFYSTVWQWIEEQLTPSLYSITKKSEHGTINRSIVSLLLRSISFTL